MAAAKKELVTIKPIERKTATLKIVGDSPLIMHAWSEKAKRMLAYPKTTDTADEKKVERNPIEAFVTSMYWLTEPPTELTQEAVIDALDNGARFGFPVSAFKQAAISAAYRKGWTKDKVTARGIFFIEPTAKDYYGLDVRKGIAERSIINSMDMVEIHSDAPIMREDMVRIGMGTSDIRWRAEFRNWWAEITLTYDANGQYGLDEIINFINAAGFTCGVGEWRPEKDGQYGMFHVEA